MQPLSRAAAAVAIMVAVLSSGAVAQTQGDQAQDAEEWQEPFRVFLADPDYVNALGEQIDLVEQQIAPECIQVLKNAKRRELRVRVKPVFKAGTLWPIWGEWREQISIERCDDPVIHNVLVTARPDGAPELTSLLPGNTRASVEMQIAASLPVVNIANARMGKECPSGQRDIVDTVVVGFLDDTDKQPIARQKWREYWLVRLCAKYLTVQVDFQPDGKGGFTHSTDLIE